jgi:anti-sigma regulatory factor (Ser/Thr protein kinase)
VTAVLQLEVPAVLNSVTPLAALTAGLAAEAALPKPRAYALRLAVEELLVNIVEHGYGPDDPDGKVLVEGDVTEDRIWVRLTDWAPEFDHTRFAEPADLEQPLSRREPGGLGLHLVRRSVDVTTYSYVGGANRTTVVLFREPVRVTIGEHRGQAEHQG